MQPTFVSYDEEDRSSSLLLLFGLPKIPELRAIVDEAKALIQLHESPSELQEHWFIRSKGIKKEGLISAVTDLEQLFGHYITDTDQSAGQEKGVN